MPTSIPGPSNILPLVPVVLVLSDSAGLALDHKTHATEKSDEPGSYI